MPTPTPKDARQAYQGIISVEAFPYSRKRIEFFQCLLLHCEIGLEIHVGRFDTFVTEPQGNSGDINPSLEQMYGC